MNDLSTKYYVRCGRIESVVMAESVEDAAWKAILQANGRELGHFFYIDERGFRGPYEDDHGNVFELTTSTLPEWTIPVSEIIED